MSSCSRWCAACASSMTAGASTGSGARSAILSQDVVDYHWGNGVSEGSTEVYIIDVITGHCGPNPKPGWVDVTKATLDKNEIGRWTLANQKL